MRPIQLRYLKHKAMKHFLYFLFFIFSLNLNAQNAAYKKLTDEGLDLLKQQNTAAALDKYKQALKIDSSKVEVNYGLGVAYLSQYEKQKTHIDNALYYINKAIKINPLYRNCFYNRGRIRAYLNDFINALADFDRCIKKDSSDANSYFCRAMVKIKLHNDDGACEDFYISSQLGFEPAQKMFRANCGIKK